MSKDFQLTPYVAEDEAKYVEQGIRVYSVDDGYSWYAAHDKESAMQCALKDWGGTPEDYWENGAEDIDCDDLDANTVNLSENEDPKGPIVTYREQIRNLIAEGAKFPCFFCGSD